jgi:hypothetical protein
MENGPEREQSDHTRRFPAWKARRVGNNRSPGPDRIVTVAAGSGISTAYAGILRSPAFAVAPTVGDALPSFRDARKMSFMNWRVGRTSLSFRMGRYPQSDFSRASFSDCSMAIAPS